MNWAKIEEITYSECDNPHELLGPHKQGSKMLVQAFFPGAEKVTIHWKKTGQVGVVAVSMAASFAFANLPVISGISSGIRTIILTVAISALAAILFPIKEDDEHAA